MFLIAGLGNPGAKYELTRHNAGFMLLDRLSEASGIRLGRSGKAEWGEGKVSGQQAVLLKPQTYMNLSGTAVARFVEEFEIPASALIVAYDDLDLPLGRIRVRKGGGSGGHKGIASILEHLGSAEFARIRLGIGRPQQGGITDYVLTPFGTGETHQLDEMLTRGVQAVEEVVTRGVDSAMNMFNSAI